MTDYIAINDTQLDPDAPLTSSLAYQWRNNPIAMAEGAAGAPLVQGHALENVFLGFLDNDVNGYSQPFTDNLSRIKRFLVVVTGLASPRIWFSTDGGSTVASEQEISVTDHFYVDLVDEEVKGIGQAGDPPVYSIVTPSVTFTANYNAIGFRRVEGYVLAIEGRG